VPRGGRIVDVGAGTGTLAIAIAAKRPDAQVIAIDGDPEVLRLAQCKPGAERVTWHRGLAGELELDDASADAVVMSLLLHHLDPGAKYRALTDTRRVLRPEGRLHVADWGRPHDPVMRAAFAVVRLIDGREGTRDQAAGRLHMFRAQAGFPRVERYGRLRTAFGSLDRLTGCGGEEVQSPADDARRKGPQRDVVDELARTALRLPPPSQHGHRGDQRHRVAEPVHVDRDRPEVDDVC
jgi:SAM-dependent methyltransferase